jgi:hypothetical protein
MKWKKSDSVTYPETWESDDGRFEILRTKTRYNISPRPVTVTKVTLYDHATGERYPSFRILRDAKEKALQLKEASDGKG